MRKLLPILLIGAWGSICYAQHPSCLPHIISQLNEQERNNFMKFKDQIDLQQLLENLSADNYIDQFGNILGTGSGMNTYFAGLFAGLDEISGDEVITSKIEKGHNRLSIRWQKAFGDVPAEGLNPDEALINEMLNRKLFPHIILSTGVKKAAVNYYNLKGLYQGSNLVSVRLGTAPKYNRKWMTRWDVGGSWLTDRSALWARTRAEEFINEQNDYGNKPVFCDADFAMMYNPGIQLKSIGHARLLTSVGVELGTYAPAHVTDQNPDNVGFTTSCAAQIGTGLSYSIDCNVIYILGTIAYGSVINSPDYMYNSQKLSTGILVNNFLDIRYSNGRQSWAPNGNKTASYHEFSVGMRLGRAQRNHVRKAVLNEIDKAGL